MKHYLISIIFRPLLLTSVILSFLPSCKKDACSACQTPVYTQPIADVILLRKVKAASQDPNLGGQVFDANKDVIVEYDSIAYQSEGNSKIIVKTAPSYVLASTSGIYSFSSMIGLDTIENPLVGEDYVLHYIMVNSHIVAAATATVPGENQLATTVHLNQGDTVRVKIANSSNVSVVSTPNLGLVRFEGHLMKGDL